MGRYPLTLFVFLSFAFLFTQCKKDAPEPMDEGLLTDIPYAPQPYDFNAPTTFPQIEEPADNLMTEEGVYLGRRLFYDPILSGDSTMSCASCHLQSGSFTDNLNVSTGIQGIAGTRSAMSLLNIGYVNAELFWDGRSDNLEELALAPIEDPIELHNQWPNVIQKFKEHHEYPKLFRQAFGITRTEEITKELAAKALAQFSRSLVSSGSSKWDRVQRNEAFFTDEELMGYLIFFDEDPSLPDAECGHCHSRPLFTTNEFINNGIEPVSGLTDFPDLGRGAVTGNPIDNGRFKVPTLRNIENTAPYMHDGRFDSLEEVLDHYDSGGHNQPNKDVLIRPLGLTEEQKAALIAFLKTLTDPEFLSDEKYSDPMQ